MREIVWIDSLENILVFLGWMFLCVIILNPIIIICLYKVEKFRIKFNLSKDGTTIEDAINFLKTIKI